MTFSEWLVVGEYGEPVGENSCTCEMFGRLTTELSVWNIADLAWFFSRKKERETNSFEKMFAEQAKPAGFPLKLYEFCWTKLELETEIVSVSIEPTKIKIKIELNNLD